MMMMMAMMMKNGSFDETSTAVPRDTTPRLTVDIVVGSWFCHDDGICVDRS
jgi:hypothetical protein